MNNGGLLQSGDGSFRGIGRESLSQCGGQPWQISGYGHSAVVDESLRMWIYGYGVPGPV